MMMVRGKRNRPVPILLPNDVTEAMVYLADPSVRNKETRKDNTYLFATSGDGPLRSYDSLKNITGELSLRCPERITSVNLRKFTATLSQVLDLTTNQLDWLCEHLGHTKTVHKQHYRQMSGYLERTEVAKIFLIQDLGLTGKFVGKKPCEITMEDIFDRDRGSEEVGDQSQGQANDQFEPYTYENSEEELLENEKPRKSTTTTRVKWTSGEIQELNKYFGKYLSTKTTPGQKECLKVINLSRKKGGELHRRNPPLIIKKISNINKK